MILKIAYLCDHSPLDRNLYSGGNARIHDALCRHAGKVTILPNTWYAAQPIRRLIEAMPDAVNLRLRWRAHLALAPIITHGLQAELARGGYDVLFCAYSLWSLHKLDAPEGMVTAFTSDTTQTVFQASELGRVHGKGFRLTRPLDAWVERCERQALRRADLILWPSHWQRMRAEARYGLSPETALRVPWGANLDRVPSAPPRSIEPDGPLRLLLVGRDWWAKGGPLAFATMQALRTQGVDARLTVIGCTPPEFHRDAYVTVHPQLDKAVPAELATFNKTFGCAHFLVQPSYESYGFAFCEASAHGLPSLCLKVGGVPVLDGVNGHLLPADAKAQDFAAVIQRYRAAPDSYAALCRSTREKYETRLNWDAWGAEVAGLLQEAVARKRG
ncbi:glycosyltransferase family 4 protein [Thetidibacter halocola]|uniref:Glycosyltransferase family 4 protein n=1 Tax=Thetidibacter halocola TaxID=2827239 RepID=A0A8J7WDU2_9RHOB|nr:glycosyltransferase family 4 protein [Thetidibacter halocola]MBS0123521.1 glycosyltransferase family 4 protein [Thetidibacter halocola]